MLRACQTDLSATAYRWKRLVAEKRYFGRLPGNASSTSGYNDGILSSILVKEGWKVGVWWLTDSLIWFQKLFSLYLSLHSSRPWLPPGHFRLLILHRYTLMYSAAGSPGGRTLPGPPHTQPPAVHSCVIHHCRFTGWPDAAWSTTHTTPSSARWKTTSGTMPSSGETTSAQCPLVPPHICTVPEPIERHRWPEKKCPVIVLSA